MKVLKKDAFYNSGDIQNNRKMYIDAAKGLALLFILKAHSYGFALPIAPYCTACFVSIFFVLGGYVFTPKNNFATFAKKKADRLIKPYFIYSIILLIICLICGCLANKDVIIAIVGIFYSTYCLFYPISMEGNIFFYLIYNNALWFLTTYFLSSILLYWIINIYQKNKILAYVISGTNLFITAGLVKFPIFLPWNLDKVFIGATLMFIGYLLNNKCELVNKPVKNSYLLLLAIIIAPIYILIVNRTPGINMATREYGYITDSDLISVSVFIVIAIIGTFLFVTFFKILENTIVTRVFVLINKYAIPIMGLHLIIFKWLNVFDSYLGSGIIWSNAKIILNIMLIIFGIKMVNGLLDYVRGRKKISKEN